MRVTSSMYYNSLYGTNNLKLNNELFDVNKQIASGLKIQYAKDDVTTFTQTMRLDNEVATLGQVKKSTQSGYKISNQSDVVLNEFETTMNRMRVLMIQAANGASDEISQDAIAEELRGLEKNVKSLANTSINGQYLFSGSAVNVKPISDDGKYHGNDKSMNAFLGSNNQQQYNLTGAELFLGDQVLTKREITSNVVNTNLLDSTKPILSTDSQLRDLMGDVDNDPSTTNTDYFYVRGTQSDGTAFNNKLSYSDTTDIQTLLDDIGSLFGNSGDVDLVNVKLNDFGQIVVEDKQKGSSKLDFHMVGAVDYSGGGSADIGLLGDIASLDVAGADSYPPAGNLYVKEFVQSGLTSPAVTNIEGLAYDRTDFTKSGSTLSSNVSQVLKKSHIVTENGVTFDTITPDKENAFAEPSTLLSEVFDLSQGTADTLDGTKLNLVGKNISGTDYRVQIDLKNTANGGSTFSLDTNADGIYDKGPYNIYNMDATRSAVDADNMTYQQLMDVVNMIVTGTVRVTPPVTPPFTNADEYDTAITDAETKGNTHLSYDGKIEFSDASTGVTPATLALYDNNSGQFGGASSVMTANTNNALTVRDPKTDFFKSIDEMITAIEDHKLYPDSSSGTVRNVGIENAIQKMDDLQDHVARMHAKVGAHSNTLNNSLQRTELLEVSTVSLRSSVIDTDIAEASLKLQQLTLNYQAMLSTVGRVSQLSLVNYL